MNRDSIFNNLSERVTKAVAHYWRARSIQQQKQGQSQKADQGLRSAVTGGAQMDGFIDLFAEIVTQAGISEQYIFKKKAVELPGFFRPTKEWDLLVIKNRSLLSLRPSLRLVLHLGTTSTIELKRPWGVLSISGRRSASVRLLKVPNLFLDIFSCWKTVRHRPVQSGLKNLISKASRSLSAHLTCGVTNCSVVNWCLSVTTRLRLSSHHPLKKESGANLKSLRMISRLSAL